MEINFGGQLKSKKTGEVVTVCKRDRDNDLLGLGYEPEGLTVKDKNGEHYFLPIESLICGN